MSRIISAYRNISLSYIKNKDGMTTNPMIGMHVGINSDDNSLVAVTYSVIAFDNPETYGYYRNYNIATFEEALNIYDTICTDSTHLTSSYGGKESVKFRSLSSLPII